MIMRDIQKLIVVILFFMMQLNPVKAQENSFGECSLPADWSNISLKQDGLPDKAAKILIISNREFIPEAEDGAYFSRDLAEYRQVSYMLASCEGGNWQMHPAKDIFSGLDKINDGSDILLFVHGHGKNLPLVLTRANQIQTRYGVSLVVFDWPSYNSNFNKSLTNVRRCGENFYNLLLQMKQYREEKLKPDQKQSMLLHSLGNYFLTHMVLNGNNQYLEEKIFDNIILNAAAVKSKDHGEVISQLRFQDRLYVALNKNDRVLRGAHLLMYGKMLGNEALDPLVPRANYVDFTSVAGSQHTYFAGYHKFEDDLPAIKHFYSGAFHGEDVDFSDSTMFTASPGKKIYQVRLP